MERDFTTKIRHLVDDYLPPVLRDNRFFMSIFFKIIFKNKSRMMIDFKQNILDLNDAEFNEINQSAVSVSLSRDVDLNKNCLIKITKSIKGTTVLDVGCGDGFLANKLSKRFKTTAVDLFLRKRRSMSKSRVRFLRGNVEKLPFKNSAFDTVICSHTLEHVKNISKALSELRRVTKHRLIIVVPKQRPYKYTFDTHLNFFPYIESIKLIMGNKGLCEEIDGDFYYQEEKEVDLKSQKR